MSFTDKKSYFTHPINLLFLYEKSLCCSAHLLTVENKKLPRSNSSKKQQNSGEQDKYKFHQEIKCEGFTYKYPNVICERQSQMEDLINQLSVPDTGRWHRKL